MPFLRVSDGESVGFVIVSEKPSTIYQHWLQGMSFECAGPGCPFCAKGMRPSARFELTIDRNGELLQWGFGRRVFVMLTFLSGERPHYAGMTVQLTRVGVGTDTQWRLAELTEPMPSPPEKTRQEREAEEVELPPDVQELIFAVKELQALEPKLSVAAAAAVRKDITERKAEIRQLLGGDGDKFAEIEF